MTPVEIIRVAAIVFVVLLFPVGYLKGCSDEKERFDDYKKMVEAAGKAQEERTAARIAHDGLLREEAENDHAEAIERIAHERDVALARMRAAAGRSVLPAVPEAPVGRSRDEAIACFDRGRLDAGLRGSFRRLADRLGAIAGDGEGVAAAFRTCATWALKEYDSAKGKEQ